MPIPQDAIAISHTGQIRCLEALNRGLLPRCEKASLGALRQTVMTGLVVRSALDAIPLYMTTAELDPDTLFAQVGPQACTLLRLDPFAQRDAEQLANMFARAWEEIVNHL